ncbi:hypothetical protein C8Q75DRAFT_851782 [Abortiporus biennis]|nr:hypothetical protein C8Q75DRAFT_851782 [Abortiporus biennis]
MIACLGRDGLAASLSISRRRTTIHYVQLNHINRSLQLSTFTGLSQWRNVRYISNLPPTTEKVERGSEPGVPLPSVKKPKLELRPAPVKLQKPESSTTVAKQSPVPPAPTNAEHHHTLTEETLVEATKHDFEDASQHGILKPPPENASKFGKLFHQAKELFKFYLRGLKLIYTNERRVKEMLRRVKADGPPLSRWESRFIRIHNEDRLKLIPFVLIIIVIEEIIPLIVMYAPFILPSTCILPSQQERIVEKRREKQQGFAVHPVFEEIRKLQDISMASITPLLSHTALASLNGLAGMSSFGPSPILKRRLVRHLTFISEDDALLTKEGMGKSLTPTQLRDAVEERGFLTAGLSAKNWQSQLSWWLTEVKSRSAEVEPVPLRVMLMAEGLAKRF